MPHELMHFMIHYGYFAILAGCMLEGEALVVLGGFFAYHHTMHLPIVALAAFVGTMISDIGWFMLGRYSSDKFIHRFAILRYISNHSVNIAGKRPRLLTFFFRFMYGFRILIPFSLGKTKMTTNTYLAYNALGILLWVAVYAGIGYFFANTIEVFFGRIKHIELVVGLVIAGVVIAFIAGHHFAEKALNRFNKN
jgi:membrane protein DedA with SNARE-associated domain